MDPVCGEEGPSGVADADGLLACQPGLGPEPRGKDAHAGHGYLACCADTGAGSYDKLLAVPVHAAVRVCHGTVRT